MVYIEVSERRHDDHPERMKFFRTLQRAICFDMRTHPDFRNPACREKKARLRPDIVQFLIIDLGLPPHLQLKEFSFSIRHITSDLMPDYRDWLERLALQIDDQVSQNEEL